MTKKQKIIYATSLIAFLLILYYSTLQLQLQIDKQANELAILKTQINESQSALAVLETLSEDTKDLSQLLNELDTDQLVSIQNQINRLQSELSEQRSKHIVDLSDEHELERLRAGAESFMKAYTSGDEQTVSNMLAPRYAVVDKTVVDLDHGGRTILDFPTQGEITFALNGYGSDISKDDFGFHYVVFVKNGDESEIFFINFTLNNYQLSPIVDNLEFDI